MTDTAIELEKLYFSTPAPPPTSSTRFPPFLPAASTTTAAATTTAVIPLLVSFSSWRDGGCMCVLRPPTTSPPSARHPPFPITPAAWWTSTPSRWGREANMTGMSHWRRKPTGEADTHTDKHTLVSTFTHSVHWEIQRLNKLSNRDGY